MVGRCDLRPAYGVGLVLAVAAFAFPLPAAAKAAEEGAVVESLAPVRQGPIGKWTRQRLEEAEPMPIVTLPEPAPSTESEATSNAQGEAARTAALRAVATGQTGAVEGVEVAAAESTISPNSANGKLFGTFEVRVGAHEYKKEDYVCSGSVVQPPITSSAHPATSDVVVTAGHCAIDPESGEKTNNEMIFVPGYRNGTAPFGVWRAEFFTTTETWKNTAKPGTRPNEGGDVAFIGLRNNSEGKSVDEVVGSFGIAFDQVCNQTYTQFGYPAESPYSGELLYSHTAPYAGADTAAGFAPVPMKIASDFTRGASGGPWAVGIGTAPTVLSLTAYGYESQPGYLYGPYFGEAAKKAYGAAFGQIIKAGVEETCAALPPPPAPPTPAPPTTTPQPGPTPVATPSLKVTRVRSRANGSAVLTAKVNAAGMLKLSGAAVRAESLDAPSAGQYRMVVAPKGPTTRRLRQVGRARVGVKVAFRAAGKTKRVSRKIQLSRRSAAGPAQQRTSRSG